MLRDIISAVKSKNAQEYVVLKQRIPEFFTMSTKKRVRLYGPFLNLVRFHNDSDTADQVWSFIRDNDVIEHIESACSVLVDIMCGCDRIDRALEIIQSTSAHVRTYMGVLHRYALRGDSDAMKHIIEEMIHRGLNPSADCFAMVLRVSMDVLWCVRMWYGLYPTELLDSSIVQVIEENLYEYEQCTFVPSGFECCSELVVMFRNWIHPRQLDELDLFIESIKDTKVVVIDGANVGYFEPGRRDPKLDFDKLRMVVNGLYETEMQPVVVLNECNIKSDEMKYWELPKFIVKHGIHDDLVWMYISMRLNAPFISNDELRDHRVKVHDTSDNVELAEWRVTQGERSLCVYDQFMIWCKTHRITFSVCKNKIDFTSSSGWGLYSVEGGLRINSGKLTHDHQSHVFNRHNGNVVTTRFEHYNYMWYTIGKAEA